MEAYDANGDMIARDGQKFRRVGFQVNGGDWDGEILTKSDAVVPVPHGSISPVYVEVESD